MEMSHPTTISSGSGVKPRRTTNHLTWWACQWPIKRTIYAVSCAWLTLGCVPSPPALGGSRGTPVSSPLQADPGLLCWASLEPPTGEQDVSLAFMAPGVAARDPDTVWLAWGDKAAQVRRWQDGHWDSIAVPQVTGSLPRFSDLGGALGRDPLLLLKANGDAGTSAVHVARREGDAWLMLGKPLLSTTQPFTHAGDAVLAFDNTGAPLVAWGEERNVRLAGLFVARWSGSAWDQLGDLKPQGTTAQLYPALAVDTANHFWVGWQEGTWPDTGLKVSVWQGAAWQDVGAPTLGGLSRGASDLRIASTGAPGDKGAEIWLAWRSVANGPHSNLALARWNGQGWDRQAPPAQSAAEGANVGSMDLVGVGGTLFLAWSQADKDGNQKLHVAQRVGGEWRQRLAGLHLVEGFSRVASVRLAAADSHSFFVAWDEVGGGRRTRLIHAYPCPVNQKPPPPPKSWNEKDTWPKTVQEASDKVLAKMSEESRVTVRETKEEDLARFHLGWGMGIRNEFGLRRGNTALLASCGGGARINPDACSMIIIRAVWKQLHEQDTVSSKAR